MDDKQLAFLRVTDPEKYKEYLQAEEIKKKLAFPKLDSNRVGAWNEDKQEYELTARMYEKFDGSVYVVEASGTYYPGQIKQRKVSRKRLNESGSFWQTYYELADGRWFDNCGILCEKPKVHITDPDQILENDNQES